jgi:hypothetical protein
MVELSEDELKIIVSLLFQLTYSLKNAQVVIPIVIKLQKHIKNPELLPENQPKPEAVSTAS